MPQRTSQLTQVGRRQIEVSNLGKVLYPADHVSKAEVLNYYLTLAPTILAHLKGRPLTVVRFPEGIDGQAFFQKNRPGWSPTWFEHALLGDEKTDYLIATEPASLVWLANLAGIELHQIHSRAPRFETPDYIVYDFDPPENYPFRDLAALAWEFKEHVESLGYHAFVKTTGRKGVHVVTPIEPNWNFQTVFETARVVAEPFVGAHASALTFQIKKDRRQGKVLLDIYRNRQSQTIVAAYSLRGVPGAPVSTPLPWEELERLTAPGVFNIHTVPQRVTTSGDPWESMAGYAVPIHTERKAAPAPRKKVLKPSRTYKTPAQLQSYSTKRSFDKTPEPQPAPVVSAGNAFVVHRHHASRLHYDLRLEHDGILRSWAVPKGLPPRPGIMRLAVRVEDHPLEYVNFEGVIPKGEYGGGTIWKFAQGRHEVTKEKKGGFYFRLQSPELNGEYRIHQTKENQWLLERVDTPQIDFLRAPIQPMLANPANRPPESKAWLYEVKWDGIRALISLDEGALSIRGRGGMDLTRQFPELHALKSFHATSALFDGEIVCLDAAGKPIFSEVISRMQQANPGAVERMRAKHPAVCYLFDCLYLDGRPIVNEPLSRRREWLLDSVRIGGPFRISESFEEGEPLLGAVRQLGLEGVMAKSRDSAYLPGKRSETWLKIKPRQTAECIIIGYTPGKGDRQHSFGALHLAQRKEGGLKYVGKVGSGFDERALRSVFSMLKKLTTSIRPVKEKPTDSGTVWIEPKLMCEVAFASLTSSGILREPVFLRMRPDLSC